MRSFGLNPDTNAHFLNLPFYETGGIKKGQLTEKDIEIIVKLLREIKPPATLPTPTARTAPAWRPCSAPSKS